MNLCKRRDLNIVNLDDQTSLVIACDSCGGVGQKEADVLKVPPFYVGSYTARVVFMEILCSGAKMVSVANNICSEMNETGLEIIKGIKHEMTKINVGHHMLTGSTEENFRTTMTGLGVTGIGVAKPDRLRFKTGKKGDYFILVGKPKVGVEVNLEDDCEIASYQHIEALLQNENVLEIVPVGSKGIAYECDSIAQLNNLKFVPVQNNIDMKKSAGPATCLVALVSGNSIDETNEKTIIGQLDGMCFSNK